MVFRRNQKDLYSALAEVAQSGMSKPNVTPVEELTSNVNPELAALLLGQAGKPSDTVGGYLGEGQYETPEKPPINRPKPKPEPVDPVANLDAILQSMLTESATSTFDYETVLRDSEDAIRQAYAAEIGAIRRNNKRARKETRRDREEVEQMYEALAKTYRKDAKREDRQGNREAKQQFNLGDQAADTVLANQSKSQSEMAALMQGLGVEEAAKDLNVFNENATAAQSTANNMLEEGQDDASRAQRVSNIESRYIRRGGRNAQLEGTNRSVDLLEQLRDYVAGNRDQIASLRGARAQELAQNQQGVESMRAEFEQKSQDSLYDRLLDYMGLKSNIEDDLADNAREDQKLMLQAQGASQESPLPDYITGPAKIASQFQGNGARGLMEIFQTFQGSPEVQANTYRDEESHTDYKMTPYAAAQLMEELAIKNGIRDVQKLNALKQMAMLAVDY